MARVLELICSYFIPTKIGYVLLGIMYNWFQSAKSGLHSFLKNYLERFNELGNRITNIARTRPRSTSSGIWSVSARFPSRHTVVATTNAGKRFTFVADALFNKQGAINALKGTAPYPKTQYAASTELHVAYAAAWLSETPFAFLARQATPEPEVTIVPVLAVDAIDLNDTQALTNHLTSIFGEGASAFGVIFLSAYREILEI